VRWEQQRGYVKPNPPCFTLGGFERQPDSGPLLSGAHVGATVHHDPAIQKNAVAWPATRTRAEGGEQISRRSRKGGSQQSRVCSCDGSVVSRGRECENDVHRAALPDEGFPFRMQFTHDLL
jgi:hypothetical protein